jgi:hypothetical protein
MTDDELEAAILGAAYDHPEGKVIVKGKRQCDLADLLEVATWLHWEPAFLKRG